MTVAKKTNPSGNDLMRWFIIGGLVVVAFFGAYRFASASSARLAVAAATGPQSRALAQQAVAPRTAAPNGSSPAGGGCACCSGGSQPTAGGVTGPQVNGTASITGGVQAIAINVTTVYSPNIIHLKAGVPAEITFSSAQGCTGQVQSQSLGFAEDLTSGPKVVSIQNPQRGTYDFACGMNMVHGKIVVE